MKLNKYENMEIKDICCEDCLFDELLEKVEGLDEEANCVRLFAGSDIITYISKKFLALEDYSFGIFEVDGVTNDYTDEYVMTIDVEKVVSCYPIGCTKVGDKRKIYHFDDCLAYVYQGDVKQDVIDSLLDDGCDVVLFGFEDEEFDLTECDDNIDENSHGFTISNYSEDGNYSSYSFYSTDKDIVQEELKLIRGIMR